MSLIQYGWKTNRRNQLITVIIKHYDKYTANFKQIHWNINRVSSIVYRNSIGASSTFIYSLCFGFRWLAAVIKLAA